MKIVVIADDLTGAAEVAGAAIRWGLSAEVHIGQLYPSSADVIVVDADSRSLDAASAYARVADLTRQALLVATNLLFKKVDSLLRGAVLAELTAMQTAAGYGQSLLLCANPRKQRTVQNGQLFVDGQPVQNTVFAFDPEHPRHTSDLCELLRHGSEGRPTSKRARDENDAGTNIQVVAPGTWSSASVLVGNAASRGDLELHLAHWLPQRSSTLIAGGAECFEALLKQLVIGEQSPLEDQSLLDDGEVLLISGSRLTQLQAWPVVACEPSLSPTESADQVCRTLTRYGKAAIRAVDFKTGSPAARIEQIVNIAGRVLATCRPAQVWIEGGHAASTMMRTLGYQRLVALFNAGDGIVALRASDESSPVYLLKPGSYPWTCQQNPTSLPVVSAAVDLEMRAKATVAAVAKKLCILLAIFGLYASAAADNPQLELDPKDAISIVAESCLDCHNAQTHEGTINLEPFQSLSDFDQDRALWNTVFDVVEAGQMPLPQSGYELSELQRQDLLSFIRRMLARPDPELKARDPGKPVLRRLTRLEYNNTVRDLFGLQYDVFMFPERLPVADKRYFTNSQNHVGNGREVSLGKVVQTSMREYGQKYDVLLPQHGLPSDNRAEYGYSNRGDALNFSPLLFEKYLQIASAIANSERLVQDSLVMRELLGIEQPPTAVVEPRANEISLGGNYPARERIGSQAAGNDTWHNTFVSELSTAFERGSGGTFDIPSSLNNQSIAGKGGLLKLQVEDDVLVINPNVDLWLAAFATADETSGQHLLTNRNKQEKVFVLTFSGLNDWEPAIKHLGVCVLSRRNQSGSVLLAAVLSNGQRIERQAEINDKSGNVFFSWAAPPGTSIEKLAVDGSAYSGDYILLDDFGFIFANPSRAPSVPFAQADTQQQTTTQQSQMLTPTSLEDRVENFLRRAYRRQVDNAERTSAISFVAAHTASGDSEAEALRRMVQAVLTSPEFLFLAEPVSASAELVRALDNDEVANRLSYFLWSSMPDEELLTVADSGGLTEPTTLRSQIRRMLADRPRIRELSESFAVQWLRLDQLYSSKPDRELFKSFYSGPQGKSTLHGPMMTEALLLFETVLVEDLSILRLYDSDFTWLNAQLAKHYGLEEAFRHAQLAAVMEGSIPESQTEKNGGNYWLRTPLPDRTRGGVLTMAGPLTLTSLPFRTSPIKRGAWLLETVFNRPPAEPKVAFVLEEATADASNLSSTSELQTKTVRQLFETHRSDPNCYSCHSRIDPPGFSLEVFDAMGSLRTHDGEQLVDASGSWNNRQFSTPAEFKDAIRVRESELVRGFVEHLLSYALGRELQHFDMQTVDQIVMDAAKQGYRMSAIIEGVALSYPFQHVRNQP